MTMLIEDKSGQILTLDQFKKKYRQIAYSSDFPPRAALDLVGAKCVIQSVSDNDLSEAVRNKRDQLLKETDWMALSDVTMSSEMTSYRQALRDITDQTGFPYSVIWPTKP